MNLPTESVPESRNVIKAVVREALETIALTLIIVILVQVAVRNFRVEGVSMQPNLQAGQYLVVDRLTHHLGREFQRGEVIIFTPPLDTDAEFVKRVVGLPGDVVELRQGQVWLNNQVWSEDFMPIGDNSSTRPITVAPGSLFVLGDNRPNSNDSRHWGLLSQDAVLGRAWFSFWPPATWGLISSDRPSRETNSRP